MDDKKRFARTIYAACQVYDKEPSSDRIQVYWHLLKDRPHEDVEAAFDVHVRRSRFFPLPVDIIELLEPIDVSPEAEALEQWGLVTSMLHDSRRARSDNALTESVVNGMGGYVALGKLSTSELSFREHVFKKLYIAMLESTTIPLERLTESRSDRIKGPTSVADFMVNES